MSTKSYTHEILLVEVDVALYHMRVFVVTAAQFQLTQLVSEVEDEIQSLKVQHVKEKLYFIQVIYADNSLYTNPGMQVLGAARHCCGVLVPNFVHKDTRKSFSFSLFYGNLMSSSTIYAISLIWLHGVTMYYILDKFLKLSRK